MNPRKLAEVKAYKDFKEVHPGVRFDKYNRDHCNFMDRQIKAHMSLMERNRLHKQFKDQW